MTVLTGVTVLTAWSLDRTDQEGHGQEGQGGQQGQDGQEGQEGQKGQEGQEGPVSSHTPRISAQDADLSVARDGTTALHVAAERGFIAAAKLLQEAGSS